MNGVPFQAGEGEEIPAHDAVLVDGPVAFCSQSPVNDQAISIKYAKGRIRVAHIHYEKH